MGTFENRKRSGMVLTGVALSSGVVSAASQNVVNAGKTSSAQESFTDCVIRLAKDNYGKIVVFLVVSGILGYFLYKMCSSSKSGEIKENIKEKEKDKDKDCGKETSIKISSNVERKIKNDVIVKQSKVASLDVLVKELQLFARDHGIDDIDFLRDVSIAKLIDKNAAVGTFDTETFDSFLEDEEVNVVYRYCLVFASIAKNMNLDGKKNKVKSILVREKKNISDEVEEKFGNIKIDEEGRKTLTNLLKQICAAIDEKYNDTFSNFEQLYSEDDDSDNKIYLGKVEKQKERLVKKIGFLINAFSKSNVVGEMNEEVKSDGNISS